jgi:alkane 1-monooxygenase
MRQNIQSGANMPAQAGRQSGMRGQAGLWRRLAPYYLLPAFLAAMAAAFLLGGAWLWLGVGCYVVVGRGGDLLIGDTGGRIAPSAAWAAELALYATLPLGALCTLLYAHYFTAADPLGLGAALGALGVDFTGARAGTAGWHLAGAILSMGLFFGSIAGIVGHELMHRPGAGARFTSLALFACCLDSACAIEHVHGHHRHVGTARDPATARRGTGFWRYLPGMAWRENRNAFAIEAARLANRGYRAWSLAWWAHNRAVAGLLLSLAAAACFYAVAGRAGLAGFLAAACIGLVNIALFNYISHYGLVRAEQAPVEPRHSWCSYKTVTGGLMFNLPRHAAHHVNPATRFWDLDIHDQVPTMPLGATTMAATALVPPLWRRITAPELARWDKELASPAERAIVAGLA